MLVCGNGVWHMTIWLALHTFLQEQKFLALLYPDAPVEVGAIREVTEGGFPVL